MPDNAIPLAPATADLADSLVTQSVATAAAHPDYAPGKYGGFNPVGAILSGMSASGAALMVEGFLADAIKAPAQAFLQANHAAIAAWLSPKIAALGAEFLGEFADKPPGKVGGDTGSRGGF